MGKRLVSSILCLGLTAMVLTGCTSSKTVSESTISGESTSKWAAIDEEFNPLEVSEAITFGEMRKLCGALPIDSEAKSFAGNVKAFENVVWQEIANGYEGFTEKAVAAGCKLEVDTTSPQGESDEEGQLSILNDQIRQGIDTVLLSPISDSNCIPGIETAHEKNIPVIAVNNEFNGADLFVGPNSLEQGKIAGEWVDKVLNGEGEVAVVMGMAKTAVTRNRTQGFEDYFTENDSKVKIVDKQNADWDRSTAKDVTATMLKTYPDLKAVFCNNDVMALGAVEAVKEAGYTLNEDFWVVGCDGTAEAVESIKVGDMAATIDTFPYYEGYMAAEVAYRYMIGQDIPRVVFTPSAMLDSTNCDNTAEENLSWIDPEFK